MKNSKEPTYDRFMDIMKLIYLCVAFAIVIIALFVESPLLYAIAGVFGFVAFLLIFSEVRDNIMDDEIIDEPIKRKL